VIKISSPKRVADVS